MGRVTEKSVAKKQGNIPEKEIDGELIILNLENGDYFALNETGGFIWKSLDGRADIGEIAKKIALCYNIDKEQCLYDALNFTDILYRKKLVVIS